MPEVDQERVLPLERRGERVEQFRGDLADVTAVAADEVYVLLLADGVIRGRAVGQVRVGHQAELLEELQRAVNGGDVDTGGGLRHLEVHLVGRGVAKVVHRLEHQLALRGEAETARAEFVRQR